MVQKFFKGCQDISGDPKVFKKMKGIFEVLQNILGDFTGFLWILTNCRRVEGI